jgi:hypothetical protein
MNAWQAWPPNISLNTGEEIIVYRPDASTFSALLVEDDNDEGGNWFSVSGDDLTNVLAAHARGADRHKGHPMSAWCSGPIPACVLKKLFDRKATL